MSLRKQLEALKIGDSIVVEVSRAAAYVTASRARVFISTKELEDGRIEITRKEDEMVSGVVSNQNQSTSLEIALATVLSLSTKDRLELLSHLELCCGMNLGECTCVPEEIVVERPPIDEKQALLADLRGKISVIGPGYGKIPAGIGALKEETAQEWVFSKDKTWYADDGYAYRKQVLAPEYKKFRTVRVDEEDPSEITKVMGF